jgi:hypothetical protein
MRNVILITMVILAGACPVRADLVFDSGYNTFDANDPYYDEVWVSNDAHLDVLGGAMGKLETIDYATANIYAGDMDLLVLQNNTVVNIYKGDIEFLAIGDFAVVNIHGGLIDYFAAASNSLANLYAYEVTYHPSGGSEDEGWIEGIYYSNDEPFSFSFYSGASYSHLIVVPEPVNAEIDITPDTLNLASKGKWISCKIWLPEDYNVADVNSASVLLEEEVPAEWIWFNERQNAVMAKFARSELEEILEPGEVELTVTGYLTDGSYFVGTDTIRVKGKGRKDNESYTEWLQKGHEL